MLCSKFKRVPINTNNSLKSICCITAIVISFSYICFILITTIYINYAEEETIQKNGDGHVDAFERIFLNDQCNLTISEIWANISNFDVFERNSQLNFGSLAKFQHVAAKLRNGVCLNVLTLGGSNSDKRWQNRNNKFLWMEWFQVYLNTQYPCKGKHQVINRAASATDSEWFLNHFEEIVLGKPWEKTINGEYNHGPKENEHNVSLWDIVVVEWSTNDGNYPDGVSPDHKVERQIELVFRSFNAFQPTPKPLLWAFEFGFSGWGQCKSCFCSAQAIHHKLFTYYNYPMTSQAHSMYHHYFDEYPNATCAEGMKKPKHWYWDDSHGTAIIHQLGGYLLSRHFDDMYGAYDHRNGIQLANRIPQPWYVKENEHESIISTTKKMIRFDKAVLQSHKALTTHGWSHNFETKKKKFGLIANDSFSTIEFDVMGDDFVFVEHLVTYENIGDALIWFDGNLQCGKAILKHRARSMATMMQNANNEQIYRLQGFVSERKSVPKTAKFQLNGRFEKMKVCTVPTNHGSKFKMLSFQTKNHFFSL